MDKSDDSKSKQSAKGKFKMSRERNLEDEATSRYAHTDGEHIDVRQMKLNDIIQRMQGLVKPADGTSPSCSKSTGGCFFESCISLYPEFARRRLAFSLDDIPSGCARNDDKPFIHAKNLKSETDCSPLDFSTPKCSPQERKPFSAREYRSPMLPRKPKIFYHGSEGRNISMGSSSQQVHYFERFQRSHVMGRPNFFHSVSSYSQQSSPEHRSPFLSSPPRYQTPAFYFDRSSSLVSSPDKPTPQSRSIIRGNIARDLFAQRVPNDARSYTWPREGPNKPRARLNTVMYRAPDERNLFFPEFKGPEEQIKPPDSK